MSSTIVLRSVFELSDEERFYNGANLDYADGYSYGFCVEDNEDNYLTRWSDDIIITKTDDVDGTLLKLQEWFGKSNSYLHEESKTLYFNYVERPHYTDPKYYIPILREDKHVNNML